MNVGRGAPNRTWSLAVLVVALAVAGACASPEVSPAAVVATPTQAPTGAATASAPTPTPGAIPTASTAVVPTTPQPSPAHWVKTGSMRESIGAVQAVKLAGGQVLAVGQRVDRDGQPTATAAELWDPATGTWRKVAALDKVRTDFALVPLQDGRALVIGGRNDSDQSFSSAWAFDPSDERWTKVGLMGTARAAPAVAVLPDGRVLVAGGYFAFKPDWGGTLDPGFRLAAYRGRRPGDDRSRAPLADVDVPPSGRAMATAELFDPRTGQWSSTGSMRYARAGAVAVTLGEGRVLVIGSSTEAGQGSVVGDPSAFSTGEGYDPATGRFSLAGELPAIHVDAPAWVDRNLPDGVGWGEAIMVGRLVALEGGGAILVSYTETGPHWRISSSTSYRFDPTKKTWSEIWPSWVSAFDEERLRAWTSSGRDHNGAVAVRLGDGRVLVAGGGGTPGYPDSPIVRTARIYDPGTDSWTKAPKMPSKATGATAVLLDDGSVLVIGGYAKQDHGYQGSRSAYRFVPAR